MQTISATELARNTRDIPDRVATQSESVAIARNHTLIAQLIPAQKTMTASQALSRLAVPVMTQMRANAWLAESKEGFGDKVLDPWA